MGAGLNAIALCKQARCEGSSSTLYSPSFFPSEGNGHEFAELANLELIEN